MLFLDEIHRFNKAQQDTLLPAVEDGLVTLIGATTETPRSRSTVRCSRACGCMRWSRSAPRRSRRCCAARSLRARRLLGTSGAGQDERGGEDETGEDPARSVAAAEVDEEAIEFLAARSAGDARTALNALELALQTAAELGETRVDVARVEDALQRKAVLYDKHGDRHYDYISAWIKATRGSDPDASLYYLAVMLEGGEDPRFIVRRMVILASEDVGNADPGALTVAVAAAQAVEHVGLPEATFALAQAAIYLALAPKSNAAGRSLSAARAHVREHGAAPVPAWLRPGARPGQEVGSYDYPHDHPGQVSPQELPEGVVGERFYKPGESEAQLAERLQQVRRMRGR